MRFHIVLTPLALLVCSILANLAENITAKFIGNATSQHDTFVYTDIQETSSAEFVERNRSFETTQIANITDRTLTSVSIRYLDVRHARKPVPFQMGILHVMAQLAAMDNADKIDEIEIDRTERPLMKFRYKDIAELTNVALLIEILTLLSDELKEHYRWTPFTFTAFFNNVIIGTGAMGNSFINPQLGLINQTVDNAAGSQNTSDSIMDIPALNLTKVDSNSGNRTNANMSLAYEASKFTRVVVFDTRPRAQRFRSFMVLDEMIRIAARLTLTPKDFILQATNVYRGNRLQLRQQLQPGVDNFFNYLTLLSIWKLVETMCETDQWQGAYVLESFGQTNVAALYLEYIPRYTEGNNATIEVDPSATF